MGSPSKQPSLAERLASRPGRSNRERHPSLNEYILEHALEIHDARKVRGVSWEHIAEDISADLGRNCAATTVQTRVSKIAPLRKPPPPRKPNSPESAPAPHSPNPTVNARQFGSTVAAENKSHLEEPEMGETSFSRAGPTLIEYT